MTELIPYIINENGYWTVAYKKRTKGVPALTVSAKGVANGLSEDFNDGFDFGVDSYDPTSTATIPYTQTSGIGEALQYAISNPNSYNSGVGRYWIPEVQLLSGYLTISKPIVLDIPYGIANLTLKGIDDMSPYIGCAFNTTSSDAYPYAINISSETLKNIAYINIHWQNMQPWVPSGYTPYGFVNFDFSSVNTGTNTFVSYNLNISNNGFTKSVNLLGFQQMYMYNFENYGGGCYVDAGTCGFFGGIAGQPIYVGGASNGSYYSNTLSLTPIGNCARILQHTSMNLGEYPLSATFTVGSIILSDTVGFATNNSGIAFLNDGGTITVNKFTVRNARASGLTANTGFIAQQGGGSHSVKIWDISGISSDTEYVWTGIPYNSPTIPTNPPVSGDVYQNTNPYDIEIDLPVYASTSGTSGTIEIYKGATNTPDSIGTEFVSGGTSSSAVTMAHVRVPAGWYFEFVGSGITIGTAKVFVA
jgi:hypothetical protein